MKNDQPRIRIELTTEQKQQIKEAAGQEVSAVEFSVEELEQRIAPMSYLKYKFTDVIIST